MTQEEFYLIAERYRKADWTKGKIDALNELRKAIHDNECHPNKRDRILHDLWCFMEDNIDGIDKLIDENLTKLQKEYASI